MKWIGERVFRVQLSHGPGNSLQAHDMIQAKTPADAAVRFFRAYFPSFQMFLPLRDEYPFGKVWSAGNTASGQRVYITEMERGQK